MTTHDRIRTIVAALGADDASRRLRAALDAGTAADQDFADALVARCRVEPDFFVRDMLTWALCRLPAGPTVETLLGELESVNPQARAQALHTLSKIGDRRAMPAVVSLLHDPDDEVARSAWRAAVVLVATGGQARLANALAEEFARGDRDTWLSLSRAFVALGDHAEATVAAHCAHPDPSVRAHAEATRRLMRDPDAAFEVSLDEARRVRAVGTDA
ncbi:HEAT repeat domain-containing protein [Gordonia sp. CPCC 206044]|uniref:HEAT repeat domain-containing protein n=1 Tax=Gordonia sp. CPCC 206044 TaxID=3140793 RepID=UPI003AF3E81E